ncbi:MAG: cell division protein FtsL [Eggerthellaceae bacterium]|nr:cell division protein FtsL [Eggerthellaceae bacterium]
MAGAAPAYTNSYPERSSPRQPRIQVIPGGTPHKWVSYLSPASVFLVKVLAAVILCFALLGFAQVWLVSQTVSTAVAAENLSKKIESARSFGSELDIRVGSLSEPSYVKKEAASLNMVPESDPVAIVLAEDIVTTDADGNLSLSLSLRAAARR